MLVVVLVVGIGGPRGFLMSEFLMLRSEMRWREGVQLWSEKKKSLGTFPG